MKHARSLLLLLLLTVPASNNYTLDTYSFGSGGAADINSSNYRMHALSGEQTGDGLSSNNYSNLPGLISVQLANTPGAPTFTNVSNDSNKLQIILDTASNPSDSEFAIAITDDDWTTTEYVQSDNTIGASLGSEDWQTYTAWGGASGEYVIGLIPDTTYKVKVKARHGDFTEGPWGPEASATTSNLTLSFDIDVSSSDTETATPYIVSLGSLTSGSVVTASEKIWIDVDTTADHGAYVYVAGTNQGLASATIGHTISSFSGDLSAEEEGFGIRTDSVNQGSGGPLIAVSPFDGSDDTVGGPSSALNEVLSTSTNAITAGRASIIVKAKIDTITPAGEDYNEVITLVAAALY